MPIANGFHRRLAMSALIVTAAVATLPTELRAQVAPAETERMDREFAEAIRLRTEGKPDEAVALLEETLARVKRMVKPGDRHIGKTMNLLGVEYYFARRYKEAETMFRESIAIGRALPGDMGGYHYNARGSLIQVLTVQGKTDDALPLAQELLAEMESMFTADDSRTIHARDTLANVYIAANRFEEAISTSRLALKSAERTFTAGDPRTIRYRHTLASALLKSGKFAEAKALFGTSLAIARKRLAPSDEAMAATLNGLAACNQSMGLEKEAAAVAIESSASTASRPGASTEEVISAFNTQAITLMNAGDFAGAETCFEKALNVSRKTFGAEHPTTTGVLVNLSALYLTTGRFGKAEQQLLRALDNVAKNPGRGTVPDATVRSTLGVAYQKTGRYAEALSMLEEAYRIIQGQKGHPEIASVRQNLGTVYYEMKEYKKAASLLDESLRDVERQFGPENIKAAQILLNLGQCSMMLAQYAEAESSLRRAAAIFAKTDPEASGAGIANNALAELCIINGRGEEAESLMRSTVAILTKRFGREHPETVTALDNLTSILLSLGRVAEAVEEFDRARRSSRLFLLKTLPAFQEDDQLAMIDALEWASRNAALTLALDRRAEPGIAARSAEWVLNGKAVTIDALATRAVLAREASDPETAGLLAELTRAQNRLATLTFARTDPGSPSASASDGDYQALADRVHDLSRRLKVTLRRPDDDDGWAALAKVRAALPADAVLVEFVRVTMRESTVRDQLTRGSRPPRYAAWVIPPTGGGEVSIVDLGPADALEQVVSEALRAVQPDRSRPLLTGNEPADEKRALAALSVLSDRLYDPPRASLDPARRWVISPDAALWLVPWAALPVAEGRYAVENHLIHLAVSGRDLLVHRTSKSASKPAILAAPDYDLAPGRAVAEAQRRGHHQAATRGTPTQRSTTRDDLVSEVFLPLPGTQNEAEAIEPLMATYAGSAPEVFLGKAASETVFKGLRGPRALVLSTHGFFLVEPEPSAASRPLPGGPPPAPRPGAAPANPLLRCGLILAGFNQRKTRPAAGDEDDGLLTALEVVSADLRGTELVVLSACETGLGEVKVGEGVAGLRQGFQLAGAGGVVASLWSVQDVESYQLMSAFFHGLAHHRGPATALREAQLALIRDRRTRLGAAHPTYWAAFALTGSPGPTWPDETLTAANSPDLPPIPLPRAVSPVTGRREAGGPWSDSALAVVLLSAGCYAARCWWRLGGATVS